MLSFFLYHIPNQAAYAIKVAISFLFQNEVNALNNVYVLKKDFIKWNYFAS